MRTIRRRTISGEAGGRLTGRHRDAPAPLRFLSPLHKATRQLTIHLQAQVSGLGVSSESGHLLTYLATYAPCPVGELSRVFGLSKSTLTGMLDRLADAGLVTRTLNAEDRRSFLVDITPAGRRMSATLRGILEALERGIASRITAAELKGFQNVMAAIADVTRVEVRPGPEPGRKKEKKP
jgi:DNA-binding MarR family transcriptional regulator